MSQYSAPLRDMQFVLFDVLKMESFWQETESLAELVDADTAKAILEESAKITGDLLAPTSRDADENGAQYADTNVTTPTHYKEVYGTISEGGWIGLSGSPDFGGMGMPKVLASLHEEMMSSADLAFSLYESLTSAASLTIYSHASEELKATYLPRLYTGEWSGTMCLTESHSGTDLGLMRTQAVDNGDGSFAITGTKIFITAGEHDLTDNIVHLVLAKLPDAPEGSRGISLFLVPKFMVNDDGSLGERNAVSCGSIEHKMGIHGSPTCVMNFDGATGYIIGQPNRGLACMFTMMNYERLNMGAQGLGCAERAYQNALSYAFERVQGRSERFEGEGAAPIALHPDVRRMLLNIKVMNEAARAFNAFVALQLDKSKFVADKEESSYATLVGELLTPVVKAFVTDTGFEACVTAQQVFGGHGYVREWGMEQLVRDARIAQIYEGTNGVQAMDLMGRKIAANGGETLTRLLADIEHFMESQTSTPQASLLPPMQAALADIRDMTTHVLNAAQSDAEELGAAAVDYLHALGYFMYGYMWLRMAESAQENLAQDSEFYGAKLKSASYYMTRILPRIHSKVALAKAGAASLYELMDAEL